MFTAIRAETAHSPTYQLLRGELKKRGGRSPKSRNQVIAGSAPLVAHQARTGRPLRLRGSAARTASLVGMAYIRGITGYGVLLLGKMLRIGLGANSPVLVPSTMY